MKVNIQDAINCVNVDINETTCENCRLFALDYSVCAEVDKIKIKALENQINIEKALKKIKDEIMSRTDVANLTMDVFVDGQVSGLERALEIIEEVMKV